MKIRKMFPMMFAIALLAGACTKASMPGENDGDDPPPGNNAEVPAVPAGTQQSDWAAIEKLEAEAKAIAKTAGCAAAGDCRAAPVGSRACGGPRYYIPYCAKSTDSASLYRKLAEVARAEEAYNKKHQIMSTCEFRMPPTVGVTAGACAEQ